jgi:hypothetical protein
MKINNQALPSVLISIAGLIAAGELLDIYLVSKFRLHAPNVADQKTNSVGGTSVTFPALGCLYSDS